MKFCDPYNTLVSFEEGSLQWGCTEYHVLTGYKNPNHASLLKYPCKVPDEWMILCSNVFNEYDLYFRVCADNPSQMFLVKKGKSLMALVPFFTDDGPWIPQKYMLKIDVWRDTFVGEEMKGGMAYPADVVGHIANPDAISMIVMEGTLNALLNIICKGDVVLLNIMPKNGDAHICVEWKTLYPIKGVAECLGELVRNGYYQMSDRQSMPPPTAVQVARSINDGHWKSPFTREMDMKSFSVHYGLKRAMSNEDQENQ